MKRRSLQLQAIVLAVLLGASFAPAGAPAPAGQIIAPAIYSTSPADKHMLSFIPPLRRDVAHAPKRLASDWRTAPAAFAMIRHAEQLRLKAYYLAGQWLIGYGHAGDTTPDMEITELQAEALLREDVAVCEEAVANAVRVRVTRNEFSALVAFCYNVGPASLARSSIVRRLNGQDRQGAADAFLYWVHATIDDVKRPVASLVERRRQERALFLSDRPRVRYAAAYQGS